MEVCFINLPILKDNDNSYFELLRGVINSVDELSTLEIRKNLDSYTFRLSLSEFIYVGELIKQLNSLHNLLKIRVIYSKSIKSSCVINFKINLVE